MFTINIYLKFALIALFLGGGIILAFIYGFWYASLPILIGIGLLVSYVMLGTVTSAGTIMQAEDYDGAEKRLNLTLSPKLLYPTNRAFFYIMKGSMATYRNDNDDAEKWLNLASGVKVPSDNEKAMIEFQFAGLAAKRSNWNKVKAHMRKLKSLNITEATLKEQIKEFEKALNSRGGNTGMMMGNKKSGMMRPGGKRRRPKMR